MPAASGVTPAAAVPVKATLTVAAASATVTAATPHHDAHHAATHVATGAVQAASAASAPASKHPAPKKKEATPKTDKADKSAKPAASASSAPASATKSAAAVATAPVAAASAAAPRALTSPVFVLNSLDGDVSVIDPTTWKEIRRVPTGKEPHHLYLTPDEKSMIVANALGDSLTFFDPRTGTVQREIRGIIDPYQLRFSPDMKWFVTAANRLNHIDIYRWDGKDIQLVKRIPTGKTPSHVWIDTKSTMIWSSMQDSDELVGIDLLTQTLKWRVKTGSLPADVFVTPDDKMLLVGLTGGKGVEIYDVTGGQPAKFIKLLPTGEGAHSFRAAGDKRHVYVSNRVANTISKIDYQTMTVVETFPVPSGPDDTEISPDGKTMMIASRWAKRLTVLDLTTHKIIREIPVGKSPHGVWTLDHAGRQ